MRLFCRFGQPCPNRGLDIKSGIILVRRGFRFFFSLLTLFERFEESADRGAAWTSDTARMHIVCRKKGLHPVVKFILMQLYITINAFGKSSGNVAGILFEILPGFHSAR